MITIYATVRGIKVEVIYLYQYVYIYVYAPWDQTIRPGDRDESEHAEIKKSRKKIEEDYTSGDCSRDNSTLFQDFEAPDLKRLKLLGRQIAQVHEFIMESGARENRVCTGTIIEVSKKINGNIPFLWGNATRQAKRQK